jgi:putative exporter of polyketide antibiotics
MRCQLRAALGVVAALGVLVGFLPLVFGLLPDRQELVWAVLGAGVYPLLLCTGLSYVRRAERNERDFRDLGA